jgi:arsenite methyltransferase
MTSDTKFWNDIAKKYAKKPVPDIAAFERKKAITREHMRPDSTVFELGCGTGSLALEMARFAGHIHGMDISAEMIRIGSQKQAAQGVQNVTFVQGTLDASSPYPREHFDSVWAYSILHLVHDRKRILRALFDLLKPGGSFISSNLCLGESWVPYGAMITIMRWFGKAPFVYTYTRETMFREIREAGFVDVEERDVGADKMVAFVVAKKPASNLATASTH